MSYTGQDGFLGTGASLLADLVLVAYIFLIVPAMITGFVFARRKMFRPYHKVTMMSILTINWVLILLLMVRALFYDVDDNLGDSPGNGRYILPAIHAALGLSAQLLGSYIVYRMLKEDRDVKRAKARGETDMSKYWFNNAKTPMRITLALWLIIATLGVATYMVRYEVVDNFNLSEEEAEGPEETPAPEATEDAGEPVATEEAVPEADGTATLAPVETEEVVETEEPDETDEPDDDDNNNDNENDNNNDDDDDDLESLAPESTDESLAAPQETEEATPVPPSPTATRRPTATRQPSATPAPSATSGISY